MCVHLPSRVQYMIMTVLEFAKNIGLLYALMNNTPEQTTAVKLSTGIAFVEEIVILVRASKFRRPLRFPAHQPRVFPPETRSAGGLVLRSHVLPRPRGGGHLPACPGLTPLEPRCRSASLRSAFPHNRPFPSSCIAAWRVRVAHVG